MWVFVGLAWTSDRGNSQSNLTSTARTLHGIWGIKIPRSKSRVWRAFRVLYSEPCYPTVCSYRLSGESITVTLTLILASSTICDSFSRVVCINFSYILLLFVTLLSTLFVLFIFSVSFAFINKKMIKFWKALWLMMNTRNYGGPNSSRTDSDFFAVLKLFYLLRKKQ